MQNSTKILIFSNCACVKPFKHKSEFGNILTLKFKIFSLQVLSTARKHYEINWAFDKYTNLCRFMQIGKFNDIYFPDRRTIDKAQFILDKSALVLKTCKIPTASLKCKMLRFFSLSFSEAAHAYSFHTKNFAVLTKFSDSLAKKLSMCKIFCPYNSRLSHNGKNTDFCILMMGPMPCWT